MSNRDESGNAAAEIKFGTDGWRGVIAEDFTYENVRKVAHAIARYVVRAEKPGSGRRGRLRHALRFGAFRARRSGGGRRHRDARVAGGGGVPHAGGFAAGAPARGRGRNSDHREPQSVSMERREVQGELRKLGVARDRRASGSRNLRKVLRDGVPALPPRNDLIHPLDVLTPYLETLDGLVDWDRLRASKFRFVIDPMHGAGLRTAARTFPPSRDRGRRNSRHARSAFRRRESGADRAARGGPAAAVLAGGYDAGFALDGDADRIGAMDRDGTFITPHQIFSILLWHLAGTRNLPATWQKRFRRRK